MLYRPATSECGEIFKETRKRWDRANSRRQKIKAHAGLHIASGQKQPEEDLFQHSGAYTIYKEAAHRKQAATPATHETTIQSESRVGGNKEDHKYKD